MKKVMVFGTFDGVHNGHRAFLAQAKRQGDWLIAVVCHDHVAAEIKGKEPQLPFEERLELLKREDEVDVAVAGDPEKGTWGVVKKFKPDVIAFGYDQEAAKRDLEDHLPEFNWCPEVMTLNEYRPSDFVKKLR